jgi:hypothetical protein
LSDPLFAVDRFERASQDRFVLAIELPHEDDRQGAINLFEGWGAISIRTVER